MKKNSKSPTKKEPKEQTSKRARSQRPVQRETKEVLAELVEKLRGKLELKATPARLGEAGQRSELRPNLDRLTVGVDLGDHWSNYCILGLEGERLSEEQVGTTQADVAFDNIGQEEVCLFLRELLRHLRGQVIVVLDNSSLVSVDDLIWRMRLRSQGPTPGPPSKQRAAAP